MKKNYIRPCVKNLEAYQVEPPQYDIILNANENPWDFPNDLKKELCETIMATNLPMPALRSSGNYSRITPAFPRISSLPAVALTKSST